MRRLLCLCALLPGIVWGAIGTPTSLGTHTEAVSSGADTAVLTTSVVHTAGHEIVVLVAFRGNRNISAVTDSAGNTYTSMGSVTQGSTNSTAKAQIFRSSGSAFLDSGETITVTSSGIGTAVFAVEAVSVSGVSNATDAFGSSSGTGSDPSASITTVAASTVTFYCVSQVTTLAPTFTEDADYTSLAGAFDADVDGTGVGISMSTGYRIRGSAGADTHDCDTALTVSWAEGLASLAESSSSPNRFVHLVPMTGAGLFR